MAQDSYLALLKKQGERTKLLSFVTKYYPAVPNLKQVLMNNWSLIRQQPLLRKNIEIHPRMQSKAEIKTFEIFQRHLRSITCERINNTCCA